MRRKYLFILLFLIFGAIGTLDMGANKTPLAAKEEVVLTPEKDLYSTLLSLHVQCPEIVYAQAILETGNFTSNVCIEYNNLFGLYNSKVGDYYRFDNWMDSVVFYIENIQSKYRPQNNYYQFLENLGYAQDPSYIDKIKEIVSNGRIRKES